MKKILPILASLCLAALVFGSAYALSGPGPAAGAAARPTKPANHPGRGHGNGGPPGHAVRRGGPCGQPARTQGPPAFGTNGKIHYDGTLTAVDAASVTVSTTVSGTVTVAVAGTTCIHLPPRKGATLADLAVGQRVGVQAVPGTAGGLVAVRIHVHKPQKTTYVGTVTAYTAGATLTLQPDTGGSPLTFSLTPSTEVKPWHRVDDLAVGREVTVQVVRDFAGPNPPVLRITVHGAGDDGDADD